jgi:hypothetical protein
MAVDREGPMWKAIELVIVGLVTVNVALQGWSLNQIVDLKEAVAGIQSNRYTSRDGMQTEQRIGIEVAAVWKEISQIRERLARKADLDSVPTPEVLRRMKSIEDKLDVIHARLDSFSDGGE